MVEYAIYDVDGKPPDKFAKMAVRRASLWFIGQLKMNHATQRHENIFRTLKRKTSQSS